MSSTDLYKLEKAATETGLFDAEWYVSQYPDVGWSGMQPFKHFMLYGYVMERDPSANFNTASYLKDHSNLTPGRDNPLEHCLRRLTAEKTVDAQTIDMRRNDAAVDLGNRRLDGYHPSKDMHGTPISLQPKPCFEFSGHNVFKQPQSGGLVLPYVCSRRCELGFHPSLGIHLHLHYPNLLGEFTKFLANIEFRFALFVSVTEQSIVSKVRTALTLSLPNANIVVQYFPNRGRDIAPFICGFGKQLSGFEIVAHIHSKVSPHNKAKADWRRQLLVNLLGSTSLIDSVMRQFRGGRNIGMMFPFYHHSLMGQISWGTNYEVCSNLADRLNLSISRDRMQLFPAGSMFWARSDALKSLLTSDLSFDDFPGESGQVDGTPAHGIERLFGEIVKQSGFDLVQIRSDKPHNLTTYYPKRWPYQQSKKVSDVIIEYQARRKKGNKIVVFTALTGNYEEPVIHEQLDADFDYVIFSDCEIDSFGFWQVRPIDYWHPEKVRMARRIKTNPHVYLDGYDLAVWIDANVIIRGDLKKYISKLKLQSDTPLAGVPHPLRSCLYDEARAVIQSGKDPSGRVERQIQHYQAVGFPKRHGLIETNFMVIDLTHPSTERIMSQWWSEINRFSHRDQISLNYVLWKNKLSWVPLFEENRSLRDSSDFAYLGHGPNSGYLRANLRGVKHREAAPLEGFTGRATEEVREHPQAVPVDIVVCVHNALEETTACLGSVLEARRKGDRIIIVDDGSYSDTASFLAAFCNKHGATLIRNDPPANGYCVSANTGMKAGQNPYFLLLNSDTILTRDALQQMLRIALSYPNTGIVGPLSNAASTQSIPDIQSTASQTAVNQLPPSISIADMNRLCQEWSKDQPVPCVPLVHGFCQLIKRKAYLEIGGFDQESFPHGYGEENDFCFRVADAGFDLRVATSAFVFHSKSASYKDDERRQQLMFSGAQALKRKHGEERVRQAVQIMENHPILRAMRRKARIHFERNSK